jgi:2-polyprenyl-6-methoxyphenol hydroxylase-like FAD-dependent oxidoreductase
MAVRRAIVVGGGITGLAAALVLGRRGIEVTLLERDPAPAVSDADAAFTAWDRGGASQIRHSHAFLGRLRNLLRDRYPDVLDALLAAGVREYRMTEFPPAALRGLPAMPGDDDLVALGCRRTTFEWVLRGVVASRPGVRIVSGAQVTGLLAERPAPPRVRGVHARIADVEQTLEADLVVDASGRRSSCVAWLDAAGAWPPEEKVESSGIAYYTRFWRLRPGAEEPAQGAHPTAGDWHWVKFGVFPADHRTFSITLAAPLAIPRMKVLARPGAFDEMVRSIPGLAPWIDPAVAVPIDDLPHPVQAMGGLQNRMRRFVDEDGPSSIGFAVLGDAAYCTNPLYGRGCSQGFIHAELLGEAPDAHGEDLRGVAIALDRAARATIEPFYRASVVADRDAVRKAEGRAPSRLAGRVQARYLEEGLLVAARCDPVVFRAFLRMMNMLETPEEAFGRTAVMLRALWVWLRPSQWNDAYRLPPAPDREATMARVEAAA